MESNIEFQKFPSIPRLSREIITTGKGKSYGS